MVNRQPVFIPLEKTVPHITVEHKTSSLTILDLKNGLLFNYIKKFSLNVLLLMVSRVCEENSREIKDISLKGKWMAASKVIEDLAFRLDI